MLTATQSNAINTAAITHDYSEEAIASFEATGDDMMEAMQERFESAIAYDTAQDVGGLCLYFTANELTAFYDYENFRGSATLLV